MEKFLQKLVLALVVCLGLSTTGFAQNVIEVAAGTDGIKGALATAVNGDIIELTTSGGEYLETDTLPVVVKLTVRAKSGLAAKPIIKGSQDVFLVHNGGLTLKGIKFDGGQYIVSCETLPGPAPAPDLSIRIDNCEFHNWTERAIYTNSSCKYPYDSILVKNSIFKDGVKQGLYLKQTRNDSNVFPGSYKYCKIENCLFIGISSTGDGHATYLEPGNRDVADKGWPVVIVDHVTVDDCAFGIYTHTTPGALVKNCIVSNMKVTSNYCYETESGRFADAPASTVKNSIRHKGRIYSGNAFVATIIENVDSVMPLYANVAIGDYSLLAGSPGKAAGTDGKDLGYIGPAIGPVTVRLTKFNLTAKVYPNPTMGPLRISLSDAMTGESTLEILDVTGKVVSKVNDLNSQKDILIDLSSSPAGMYYGIIKSGNKTKSFKVIKK